MTSKINNQHTLVGRPFGDAYQPLKGLDPYAIQINTRDTLVSFVRGGGRRRRRLFFVFNHTGGELGGLAVWHMSITQP